MSRSAQCQLLRQWRLIPVAHLFRWGLTRYMKKRLYIFLIVFSSLQVILAVLSLIGFFGFQSEGGARPAKASREEVQSWLDRGPTRQNLNAEVMGYDTRERDFVGTIHLLQVWVLVLGVFCLFGGALIFAMASRSRSRPQFQQAAPPNGGPVAVLGNSEVVEGPPSVS